MTVLLGSSSAGVDGANSNSAGTPFAQKFTASGTGTISRVWLKNGATIPSAANAHYAIYADSAGTPGSRLTADLTGTAPTANAWSSFPVSLAVTSGTVYWIAFLSANSGAVTWAYTNNAASGGNESDGSAGANALPTPYSQAATFATIVNMYAESDDAATYQPHAGPRVML